MRTLFFALLQVVCSEFFIDDSILYKVDFPGLDDETALGIENDGEMESYTLISKNKEKYECFIPRVSEDQDQKISKYSGESPVQLIESLLNKSCVSTGSSPTGTMNYAMENIYVNIMRRGLGRISNYKNISLEGTARRCWHS